MDEARWFTEEVHRYDSALGAYLHSNFPGMQDVDDVVQDSYLKLLKARPAGKIASVKAYLFTTARNAALKVFRKRRIISDTPVNELPDWRVLDGGQNVVEVADAHLKDALIAEAAAQLPDRCREIFKLRVARGLAFAFLPGRAPSSSASVPPAAVSSIALRPDRQVLPDGSSVELNASAEFVVEFTPEKRGVRLVRGEALFDVAKDPARPFVVAAGQIEVRAVGTAFTVRRARDEIAVLVTEGEVAVDLVAPGKQARTGSPAIVPERINLVAGRKVTILSDVAVAVPEPEKVSPEEVAEALEWRNRRVEFTSTRLTEAVSLFNAQSGRQLVLGDGSIGDLRITGVFWTNDPEGFSRLLVSSLGLKADADARDRIVLRKYAPWVASM